MENKSSNQSISKGGRPRTSWRCKATVPGVLASVAEKRYSEFKYDSFSPYCIDLVCFDLRTRVPHTVTYEYSTESDVVQDAIDREIVRHYTPNSERKGLLVLKALQESISQLNPVPCPDGLLATENYTVRFPIKLQEIIEIRWKELEYESRSEIAPFGLVCLCRFGPRYCWPDRRHEYRD